MHSYLKKPHLILDFKMATNEKFHVENNVIITTKDVITVEEVSNYLKENLNNCFEMHFLSVRFTTIRHLKEKLSLKFLQY